MEQCKNYVSRLFVYSGVDYKDDEEKYERAYQYVQSQISSLSDKELHDLLTQLACKDKQHEEISIGLLYIILTDEQLAPKTYRDLTLITRDGLNCVTTNLAILIADKYTKFSDIGRRQLLWLLRELIKNQVPNVETLVWNCLRQASGGDISIRNLFLIEGLLNIFIEHRQWLEKHVFLISAVVYSYVRLIEDHINPNLTALRNKEVKFVISLIRDRFADIIHLGRDFVRLLQNVARIPEFEQLWRDILLNPKSLCQHFNGVWQLLQNRTSRRFLQCRLTPEVERKLHFLTSSVKFGNHKRYQDWFQDKYFSTPESHSLRSDLIRFIINVIHPTNDMLCSDIIPRWAIIGWLLTSCTNPIAQSNAKLALFYDWLFFDPLKDNIMNVEPGILVMYHSIRNHPLVSSTLLDFLCRIIKNFYPKNEDKIRTGVYNSLKKILEKQVIPNLHPLFESPKLDRELRSLIRENFREFCITPNSITSSLITTTTTTTTSSTTSSTTTNSIISNNATITITTTTTSILPIINSTTSLNDPDHHISRNNTKHLIGDDIKMEQHHHNHFNPSGMVIVNDLNQTNRLDYDGIGSSIVSGIGNLGVGAISPLDGGVNIIGGNNVGVLHSVSIPKDEEINIDNETEAVFSDDEDETMNAVDCKTDDLTDDDDDLPLSKVRLKEKPAPDKVDIPATIIDSFEKFIQIKTTGTFENFLNDYRTLPPSQALDQEQQQYVFNHLINVIKQTLPQTIFTESKSDEKLLAESISYPLFSLFRIMYQYEDKCKKSLQTLLTALIQRISSIGYMILYFLKVYTKLQSRKNPNQNYPFKISIYKQLCDANLNNDDKLIDKCLVRDLNDLESEDSQIFIWLIPDIFREFKQIAVNNSEIIKIILSCIDAKNLRDLIYSVTQGKLILFKNDDIIDCVRDSLCYETFEQFCFWQLVQAHDVPIEVLQDILPDLESSNHAEALTYMLFILKSEKPTTEIIRLLLSRETKNRGDSFVTSSLRYWCQESEEILSEIIANLLTSKYPNSSPNKRKRPLKSQTAMNSSPSADQLLSHLEHFRRSCRHGNGTGTGLYVQDAMQRALQQAYSHSSDSTKKQYSDLFALAAEDETSGVGRRGGSGRGRKQPNSKKDTNSSASNNKKNSEPVNNYTSDEESSDDDWSKPKQSKRRKKALSDSD